MYAERVIARRMAKLAAFLRETYNPEFDFHDFTPGEAAELAAGLDHAFDPAKKVQLRPLRSEEEAFVVHEINRSKVDFPFWASRYAKIKAKSQDLVPIRFNYVQELLLERIGELEEAAMRGERRDGVLLAVLKARQMGISTISEAILAHRVFFYANTTALIAADADKRSAHLFDMMERIYANLPWWMRPISADPKQDYHVKDRQLFFADQDSQVVVSSARTMDESLGTGLTLPLSHLSELAIWGMQAFQIDDAFVPAVPTHPRTFSIWESTAKGRGNWWHAAWMNARNGLGRWEPVFFGYYLDPETYAKRAPADWQPSERALAHAARVEASSPRWCKGRTTRLTRDQLFWWEQTRAEHVETHKLHKFLAEYCADDLEAFQASQESVFRPELLADLRERADPEDPVFLDVRPKTELAAK